MIFLRLFHKIPSLRSSHFSASRFSTIPKDNKPSSDVTGVVTVPPTEIDVIPSEQFQKQRTAIFNQDNFTEFSKQFGFVESLEDVKTRNEQREKRKYMKFSLGALVSIGIVTGIMLLGIDPALEKWLKQAYFIHSTNLLLKNIKFNYPFTQPNLSFCALKEESLLNSRGSLRRRVVLIQKYLDSMDKNELRQPTFNLVLLEELKLILQRALLLNDQQELIEMIISLVNRIRMSIVTGSSQKKYKRYHSQYLSIMEQITLSYINQLQKQQGQQQKIVDGLGDNQDVSNQAVKHQKNTQISNYLSDPILQEIIFEAFLIETNHKQLNSFIQYLNLSEMSIETMDLTQLKALLNQGIRCAQEAKTYVCQQDSDNNLTDISQLPIKPYDPQAEVSMDDFTAFQTQYYREYARSVAYCVQLMINRGIRSEQKTQEKDVKNELNELKCLIKAIDLM